MIANRAAIEWPMTYTEDLADKEKTNLTKMTNDLKIGWLQKPGMRTMMSRKTEDQIVNNSKLRKEIETAKIAIKSRVIDVK